MTEPKAPDDEDEVRFTVAADEDGAAAIEVLAERLFDIGTTELRRLCRDHRVTVGDSPCSQDRVLKTGDAVRVDLAGLDALFRIEPRPLEGFEVRYEDDAALVCQKPGGVAVISERGERDSPFLGAVLAHLLVAAEAKGLPRPPRPRVVHRIDKETSGAVLVAKTRAAMRALTAQFEERTIEKEYVALVRGSPLDDEGTIDLPIGPSAQQGKMRAGGRDAKPARTSFKVVERFEGFTLLSLVPHTGRQHQIRAHLEAIGYPLAVDPLYGGEEGLFLSQVKLKYKAKEGGEAPLVGRLTLHAARIAFRSPALPASAPLVVVEVPLPRDLAVALKQLRKWATPGRRRSGNRSRARHDP